jgi:hypothetical protein
VPQTEKQEKLFFYILAVTSERRIYFLEEVCLLRCPREKMSVTDITDTEILEFLGKSLWLVINMFY